MGGGEAKPGRARAPPRAGQLEPAVRPVAPSVALVDSGRRAGAAAEEAVGRRRCSAPADCQRLALASARLGPPERRRVERRQRRAAERARHPGLRLRRAVGPPGRRTGSSKPPGSRKDRQARRQPGYCLRSLCLSRGEWWRGPSGFQPMNQGTGGGLARQARRRRTARPRWPPQNNSASLSSASPSRCLGGIIVCVLWSSPPDRTGGRSALIGSGAGVARLSGGVSGTFGSDGVNSDGVKSNAGPTCRARAVSTIISGETSRWPVRCAATRASRQRTLISLGTPPE